MYIYRKMCKFLALLTLQDTKHGCFLHQLSCKMKILEVSCTSNLVRWKSCKFLIQANFWSGNSWKIPKILRHSSYTSFTPCNFLYHLCFWWITGIHKFQFFLVVSGVISLSKFMHASECFVRTCTLEAQVAEGGYKRASLLKSANYFLGHSLHEIFTI